MISGKHASHIFQSIGFFQVTFHQLIFLVLLQFSWRRGSKGSRGQGFKGLFSKDFQVFVIL